MRILTKKIVLFLLILITVASVILLIRYVGNTFSPIQVAAFIGNLIGWVAVLCVAALVICGAWELASTWIDSIEKKKAVKAEIMAAEAKWNKGD